MPNSESSNETLIEKYLNPSYADLSRIWYLHPQPKVRLRSHSCQATAILLKLVDRYRLQLSGIANYDQFVDMLRQFNQQEDQPVLPTSGAFSVDGFSADWITAFQYNHNQVHQAKVLFIVLSELKELTLPLGPEVLDLVSPEANSAIFTLM